MAQRLAETASSPWAVVELDKFCTPEHTQKASGGAVDGRC